MTTPAISAGAARQTFDRAFIRAALVTGGHRARAAASSGACRGRGLAKLMARLDIDDPGDAAGTRETS